MRMKKLLCRIAVAFTLLFTTNVTFQMVDKTNVSHAATNYYAKYNCTWYVFNKRAKVHKPIPNGWGNAKYWYTNAKRSDYRVGTKPAPRAILQSTAGYYGHVAYVETVYRNGSIKISEYNYSRAHAYGTRILSKSTAKKYHYIY